MLFPQHRYTCASIRVRAFSWPTQLTTHRLVFNEREYSREYYRGYSRGYSCSLRYYCSHKGFVKGTKQGMAGRIRQWVGNQKGTITVCADTAE
ncbi:uncharacterized protein YALI1_B04663g [Yarrowia lipolytica]|uniref:Uncharacterized protein n=1 Tax=Yarrowia lipolytica TaxID=4952 RepID=A0A1D8N6A6_YARLL|nr:hypothetical protein YALI1_B04663g [Yarrowia lipolytica]